MCNLSSPTVMQAVEDAIFKAIKSARKASNPRQDFANSIRDIAEQYKNEDKNQLTNYINNYLVSSGDRAYARIGGNWSLEDIEVLVKGNFGTSMESENKPSKTDALDNPETPSPSQFLDRVYGTSTAKDKLLKDIRNHFKGIFFISDIIGSDGQVIGGEEVIDLIAINRNIKKYQNLLFNEIKLYYSPIINNPEFDALKLYDERYNYTGDLEILNRFLQPYQFEYTIDNLQKLSSNIHPKAQSKFKAINALFTLNNFDNLISQLLGKAIEIKNGTHGSYVRDNDKYTINLTNLAMTHTWRDDGKDIDAVAEANALIKLLFESMDAYNHRGDKLNSKLSYKAVSAANAAVRQLMGNSEAKKAISIKAIDNVRDLDSELGARLDKMLQEFTSRGEFLTVADLVAQSFDDAVEAPRLLYAYLVANKNKYDKALSTQHLDTIQSIYNGVFDAENPASFYSIFIDTLNKPDSTLKNNQYYYLFLTQNMGTQENLDSQQYSRENNTMKNITLKSSADSAKTYAVDQRLSGIFNVNITPKYKDGDSFTEVFKHYEVNYSSLKNNKDPYVDIRVGNLIVRKYGKKLNVQLLDEAGNTIDLKNIGDVFPRLAPFLTEVTGFRINNPVFTDELQNRFGDYQKALLNYAAGILYNYSVSRHLKNTVTSSSFDKSRYDIYNERLANYYSEGNVPKVKQTVSGGQLSYSNDIDTPIKVALVRTNNAINGIVEDTMSKDAKGSTIANTGLSQISTRHLAQTKRASRVNPAVRAFSANKLFVNQEFARDFKSQNGTVKAATSMTEAEHFIGNFVYDFVNAYYGPDGSPSPSIVKLMPTVISDKSRIMKTLFNLNQTAPAYVDVDGVEKFFLTDKGVKKTYGQLDYSEWRKLTKHELGNYYKQIYTDTANTFKVINDYINDLTNTQEAAVRPALRVLQNYLKKGHSINLDFDNNFGGFNLTMAAIAADEKMAGKYFGKMDNLIKDVMHEVALANLGTELTSIIHYTVRKGLHGNALLFDQLYRWGCKLPAGIDPETNKPIYKTIELDDDTYKAYGLNTGYGTSDEFFKAKEYQYLNDLMKDNCEVRMYDNLYNEYKDNAFTRFKKSGWTRGENVIFGKISYKYYEKGSSEPITRTISITDKDSLRSEYIYKQLRRASSFPNYAEVRDFIDIDKPTFRFDKFLEAIHIFNTQNSHFRQLGELRDKLKEALLNAEITDVKHQDIITNEAFQKFLAGDKSGFISEDPRVQKVIDSVIAGYDLKASDFNDLRTKSATLPKPELIMNPDLQLYQSIDYMLSQEHVNSVVGTHLNHPAKGGTLIEQESTAWGQQVKRNVSMTASKHKFITTSLDGILSTARIAVVEDDKDFVCSVTGETSDDVKPFDGATFGNGILNYLENTSLKGDKAGINKKIFIHDYKAKTGTGIIVKTAEFPITNGLLRDSIMLQRMNKKMLNIPFTDVNGNPMFPDITKDYNGNDLFSRYGDIVYKEGNNIYKVAGLEYNNGVTRVLRRVLTKEGWQQDLPLELTLTNNYDIWQQVFGGQNSITLEIDNINAAKLGETSYTMSENSWAQLAYASNWVGTKNPGVDVPTTNMDVDQVLKRSIINYVVTEGAIKQGAANINSKTAYFDDNYELATMELGMYDAGIQLDAEHHADKSTLSMMTQVLNALAARGYSVNPADEVYQALRGLVKEALTGFDWSDTDIKNADTPEMQNFLADITLKAVKTTSDTDGNLIAALSKAILDKYNSGGKVEYDLIRENMPMSNSGTFNKMVSQFAALLTNKAIKIKFPGTMSVMVPSNKIYRLYADHLLSHYDGSLDSVPEYASENTVVTDVQLGRTYRIFDTNTGTLVDVNGNRSETDVLIENPNDYWALKDLVAVSPNLQITENIKAGRDLASYNVRITVQGDKTIYNIWDLDEVKQCYDETLNSNPETRKQLMQNLQVALTNLSKGQTVNIKGQPKVITSTEVKPYELIMSKIYETAFGLKAGDDVQSISNNEAFFIERQLDNWTSNIESDKYDLELKRVNGKHLYLIDSSSQVPAGFTKVNAEIRQDANGVYRVDVHGQKMYSLSSANDSIYIDDKGNEVIVTDNLQYYVDKTSFSHITISPRVATWEARNSFGNILNKLAESNKQSVKNLLEWVGFTELMEKSKEGASEDLGQLVERIQKNIQVSYANLEKDRKQLKKLIQNANGDYSFLDEFKTRSKALLNIINQGREIHTSFLKSLNVLAARIPAQCHQSFMAMKVVGFEESGVNNAYVSRMQIWLQGSDYDIDKVSLLGYEFNSGKFVKWSPEMNLTTKLHLKASEKLPFPTGVQLDIKYVDDKEFQDLNNALTMHEEGTPRHIEILAKIIKRVNKLGYIPTNITGYEAMADKINRHNMYFSGGRDRKQALINFISSYMYNISADPINLIQGQAPIDTAVDVVKKLSAGKPMEVRSKEFAPGSPQTKNTQVKLTITGKENTGIVASFLKNHEAISHYTYTRLQEGTAEEQERLLIDKTIFGKKIRLYANAYTENEQTVLHRGVRNALAAVDNTRDSFVDISAFLSLSTDNAKDPTLAKINAGPQLISLYTAGLGLGFSVEDLISIVTSDFGWALNDLLQSNVFNDTQGQFSIDGVFDFLDNGPIKEYKALTSDVKKELAHWAQVFYTKQQMLAGVKPSEIKTELTDAEIVRVLKNPSLKLERLLGRKNVSDNEIEQSAKQVETLQLQYLKKRINKLEKDIEKLKLQGKDYTDLVKEQNIYNGLYTKKLASDIPLREAYTNTQDFEKDLAVYNAEQEILQDLSSLAQVEVDVVNSDVYDQIDKAKYSEKASFRLRRFVKALRKYHHVKRLADRSEITNSDGVKFKAYQVIRQLNLVANEHSRLRPLLGLNQGLPNDIQSQLRFMRNFESIITQRLAEIPGDHSNFVEELQAVTGRKDTQISFEKFVTDPNYREQIIKLYNKKKMAVNIFDVVNSVGHYFGYLETMYALTKTAGLSSKVYAESNIISRDILSKYVDVTKSSTDKAMRKVVKFITGKLNNQFLLSKDIVITVPSGKIYDNKGREFDANNTEIVLGTPSGNASFKRWMEETVIPQLKVNLSTNDFIKSLQMVSTDLTWDGMSSLNMSLNINMMPKSDSERAEFKKFKDSLNALRKRDYGQHKLIDLFFYYNLIAYNGESSQNSFTSLFEDIFAEKGENAVTDWIKFYSVFDKEGSFQVGIDYQEDELLRFLATKESPETAKLPYIRVYNPNTMQIELAERIQKDDVPMDENDPAYQEWQQVMEAIQDNTSENPDEGNDMPNNANGMTIEERLFQNGYQFVENGVVTYPRHFTNGYVALSERVTLSGDASIIGNDTIEVRGKKYSEEDIQELAKKNGHGDVKLSDVIVQSSRKDGINIDVKRTKFNLDRIFKENNCK